MITEEEKQNIVDLAAEKALLLLPETVGALMAQQASLHKLNREFYAEHPEFQNHKDAVMSVIEQVEGKDPMKKYEDILKEAVPEIRKRINTMKNLDMNNVSTNPDRKFKRLDAPSDNPQGEI